MKTILATVMLAATACSASAATLYTCHDEKQTAIGRWMVEDATYLVDREARVVKGFEERDSVLDPGRNEMFQFRLVREADKALVEYKGLQELVAKQQLKPGVYRMAEGPVPFVVQNGVLQISSRSIDLRSGLSKDKFYDRISKCSMSEKRT